VPGIHVFLVKIHHEDTENTKVPKRTAIFVLFVSSWFAVFVYSIPSELPVGLADLVRRFPMIG
jgi:hypothetical protein